MGAFREALSRDKQAVLELYRAVSALEDSFWDESYPDMSFIEADIAARGLFLFEEDGHFIGAVSLIEHDDLDELPCWRGSRSCVLARLCTHPARRREGKAGDMVRFAVDTARRQGFDSIRLLADARHETAHRLYRRCGFEKRANASFYGHEYGAWEYLIVPLETA